MSSTEKVKAPTNIHSLAEANDKICVGTSEAEDTESVPSIDICTRWYSSDYEDEYTIETDLSEKDDEEGSYNYMQSKLKRGSKKPDIRQVRSIAVTGAGSTEANGTYEYRGLCNGSPLFTLVVEKSVVDFHLFHVEEEGRWIITEGAIACYECINHYGYQICVVRDGINSMKKANIIADPLASKWETCGVGENPAPKLSVVDEHP